MKKILVMLALMACVFLYSERSGTHKICWYDCGAGGMKALTVGAVEMCPTTY